jgi:hypothetical protein
LEKSRAARAKVTAKTDKNQNSAFEEAKSEGPAKTAHSSLNT